MSNSNTWDPNQRRDEHTYRAVVHNLENGHVLKSEPQRLWLAKKLKERDRSAMRLRLLGYAYAGLVASLRTILTACQMAMEQIENERPLVRRWVEGME